MKPFIDFIERIYPDGTVRIALQAEELPTARDGRRFMFFIEYGGLYNDPGFHCRSRANGAGSLRYRTFSTLDEAMQAGRKWATRKIMEARREQRRSR